MKSQKKRQINILAKAKITNEVLSLADSMFKKGDLPNRTASVLLYFNLTEWYLGFLVRQIPLSLNQKTFNQAPLGKKINMLKKQNFYYKDELLTMLRQFNNYRKKIVHKMVETIFDTQMEKSINGTRRLFDELNEYLVLIAKKHGLT